MLLPGWCLFSLLGLKSVAPALALPAAIGMGLSVESVAAWLAWLSGTGMIGAAVLTLLATAGAVGARIVWRNHATPPERPGRFELGAAALAAVAIGCVVVSGPWLVPSADTFYHMAAARDLLVENRAIPQVVLFGATVPYPDLTGGSLQLVLGWLSLVSGMIPAWAALAFFGAPLTTVCLAVFAREITRSTSAALIATALYLVVGQELDMRAAGYPRSIADGLAWLSLTFLVRFARSDPRSWRELVAACVLAFTAASVHSGTSPLIVAMISATFVMATLVALRARRLRSMVPFAIACSVLMLAMLPLLAVRVLAALPPPGPEASLATQAPYLKILMRHGYAFIDERFWFGSLVTVATLGTLCLLGRARRLLLDGDVGAAMLWGGLLIVPVVAATPVLTNWPIGLYFFYRLAELLVPLLSIPLGWELSRLGDLVVVIRTRKVAPAAAMRLAGVLVLACATVYAVAAQLPVGVFAIYFGRGNASISYSRNHNATVLWAGPVRALETAGPGVLLANAETSFELAGLTGHGIIAVPFGHWSYQYEAEGGALRRGDVADALSPAADPSALLSVLFRYRVTFVLVDRATDGAATWDWIAGQKVLQPVAQSSSWALYRFDSSRLDQALDIPLNGGVGMFSSRVIAGRAVFVRITSPGHDTFAHATAVGLTTGATYQTQFAVPDQAGATITAPLLLPDAAPVDRYTVTVSFPSQAPIQVGQVEVGHAYEAEFFAGVTFDLHRGYVQQPGWDSVNDPGYGRGGAARALRTGKTASYPLTDAPGDYCLSVFVFDAGDGVAHMLDVGLGNTVIAASWSGSSWGMRDVEMAAVLGPSSHQLKYWVPTGAPIGAIIDRITLFPPPASSEGCLSASR
jgi:hypothetical protein